MEKMVKKQYQNTKLNQLLLSSFGFGIALFFLGLLFHKVDINILFHGLTNLSVNYVIFAVLLLFFAYFIRVFRWWIMLSALSPIKLKHCFVPFFSCMALNNLLPLRSGDIIRIFSFTKSKLIATSEVLATLILERIFDLATVLCLFFVSFRGITQTTLPKSLINMIEILTIIAITCFVVALILPRQIQKIIEIIINNKRSNPQKHLKALEIIQRFFNALQLINSPIYLIVLTLLSVITWIVEGSVYLIVLLALKYPIKPLGAYFAFTMGAFSTLIPSTPGYIGTFDYFTMLGLSSFNATKIQGTTFAISVHVIIWLPITIVGLLCYGWQFLRVYKWSQNGNLYE